MKIWILLVIFATDYGEVKVDFDLYYDEAECKEEELKINDVRGNRITAFCREKGIRP